MCWQHYHTHPNRKCKAIRREVIALGELLKDLPGLLNMTHEDFAKYYIGNDFTVKSCKLLRRPDMMFILPHFGVLVEFDEFGHQDRTALSELEHLHVIKEWVREVHKLDHLYVLRINPDLEGREMFKKKRSRNGEYLYHTTVHFEERIANCAGTLGRWIARGIEGPVPLEMSKIEHQTLIEYID